jgi:hypothetical protein
MGHLDRVTRFCLLALFCPPKADLRLGRQSGFQLSIGMTSILGGRSSFVPFGCSRRFWFRGRQMVPALQSTGKLGNKRRQPHISPPAAQAACIHRLAHLRAADRAHTGVGFVKAFASGGGRQADMGQHTRQSASEIRHLISEPDGQHRVRQRGAPMRHQPILLDDGPAEIGEVVHIAVMTEEAEGEDRESDVANRARNG